MSTPTGVNWADAVDSLEARRRVRVVASFAEDLAEDVRGTRSDAQSIPSLAEWSRTTASCWYDAQQRIRHPAGQAAVVENNREAVELLDSSPARNRGRHSPAASISGSWCGKATAGSRRRGRRHVRRCSG